MRILFVINPRSGSKNHKQTEEELKAHCLANAIEFKIHFLSKDKDQATLQSIISSFSPQVVVACGGDGTVNFVGSVLLDKDILFSIVPLGSANGLATALGIRLETKIIVEKILKKKFIHMDVLHINNRFNCFHLSSLGLNAQLVKKYDDADDKGMWGYAKHFVSTIAHSKPKKYIFQLNGDKFKKHADMITFANAKKYGTGAVVNPDGKINDGKFEVCIFRPFPWYELLSLSYHFFFGNLKKSPFVKIIPTNKVQVISESKEILEIDGDVQGEFSQIDVEVQKGALKMIYGDQ